MSFSQGFEKVAGVSPVSSLGKGLGTLLSYPGRILGSAGRKASTFAGEVGQGFQEGKVTGALNARVDRHGRNVAQRYESLAPRLAKRQYKDDMKAYQKLPKAQKKSVDKPKSSAYQAPKYEDAMRQHVKTVVKRRQSAPKPSFIEKHPYMTAGAGLAAGATLFGGGEPQNNPQFVSYPGQ